MSSSVQSTGSGTLASPRASRNFGASTNIGPFVRFAAVAGTTIGPGQIISASARRYLAIAARCHGSGSRLPLSQTCACRQDTSSSRQRSSISAPPSISARTRGSFGTFYRPGSRPTSSPWERSHRQPEVTEAVPCAKPRRSDKRSAGGPARTRRRPRSGINSRCLTGPVSAQAVFYGFLRWSSLPLRRTSSPRCNLVIGRHDRRVGKLVMPGLSFRTPQHP